MQDTSNPNSPTPDAPKRSRRFFTLRLLGRSLMVLAILATLVALFYAEENWRGRRAWERYERDAEARDVNLDWNKLIPAPVPDDQNFAMTPFLAPLFQFVASNGNDPHWQPYKFADSNAVNRTREFGDELLKNFEARSPGKFTDLEAAVIGIQKTTKQIVPADATNSRTGAATYLLDYMKRYDPVFNEIRAASKRPYSRFNVQYDDQDPAGILLPHLAIIRKLSLLFSIKASSELSLGKTQPAFEDVEFMTRLADCIETEPMMISQLVRFAIFSRADEVIGEGLAEHRWSDAQLASFETDMGKVSFIKDVQLAFQGERTAFGVKFFDYMRAKGISMLTFDNELVVQNSIIPDPTPRGWTYLDQIQLQKIYDNIFMPSLDVEKNRIYPDILKSRIAEFQNKRPNVVSAIFHHEFMARMLAPALAPTFQKSAYAQNEVNETIIACALERYRLANGKYPESLDGLAPQFVDKVPTDICTGEPMKYHRTDDGKFVLYSVGWNQKDDGGTVVMVKNNKSKMDLSQGDWVWPEYNSPPSSGKAQN